MSALDEDKVEKIDKLGATSKSAPLDAMEEPEARLAPNKERFDALMIASNPSDMEVSSTGRKVDTTKVSLIDEVSAMNRRVDQVKRSSPEHLVAQAEGVINDMEDLKKKLNTPNLEIKDSMQGMLRNKLTHIDESLKVALSKAGVEYKVPQAVAPPSNPIERFLGMLTDSQSQLQGLTGELRSMHMNNRDISPATMLLMQVKVGFIQQEVELFTSLLSKALESTKTIMNVQV